jgi:hypothetical protein
MASSEDIEAVLGIQLLGLTSSGMQVIDCREVGVPHNQTKKRAICRNQC